MTNYTNLILSYLLGELTQAEREQFESELEFNHQLRLEYNLQLRLDSYMKMRIGLDEAERDPDLKLAEAMSKDDIREFLGKLHQNKKETPKSVDTLEEEFDEQLQKAEIEMIVNKIDQVTGDWVREWQPRKKAAIHANDAIDIAAIIEASERRRKDLPPARPKERFSRSGRLIGAGLGLIVILFAIALLFNNAAKPTYTPDELFETYYQPLTDNSFQARGNNQETDQLFREGIDLYLAANYNEANLKFDQLRQQNEGPLAPEVLLYSGLTKTANGDYPQAIELFKSLLSSSDQFNQEAKWYLGLCYLKSGDTQKAKPILEELADQKFYMKKAQNILNDLK